MEYIAEEGNVGGVLFEEQNIYACSGNRRGWADALFGLIFPSGFGVVDRFFGLLQELARATEDGVRLRARISRRRAHVLGLPLDVRGAQRSPGLWLVFIW
jgi:hypothetical protein